MIASLTLKLLAKGLRKCSSNDLSASNYDLSQKSRL